MSVELPKDAEGREIPLETKVMYGYGGPAEIVDNGRYDPGTYFVGCLYCGARSDYEHDEENAAELWNGRVESNDH